MPAPLSRRTLLAGLGGLGVGALAGPTFAQAPAGARFRVEVLVFRQPGATPPAPTVMTLPEAAAPETNPRIQLLPAAEWRFGNLGGALRRSSGYRVLGQGAWIATVPANGSTTANLAEMLGPGSGVNGAVTVQRGQYLFLRVQVNWPTPEGGVHQLRERRRVRFDERHYFDHPALGVIAQVSQA
ncbi:MAG: CsiV family protein [Steroidobacteraceae bacterium]|jgi:hypothetical protein|nr:CsiV family protein [Steroidobacteraceae bacterium]